MVWNGGGLRPHPGLTTGMGMNKQRLLWAAYAMTFVAWIVLVVLFPEPVNRPEGVYQGRTTSEWEAEPALPALRRLRGDSNVKHDYFSDEGAADLAIKQIEYDIWIKHRAN